MVIKSLLADEEVKNLFGDFKYKDRKNGRIVIEKKWVSENIVALGIPLLRKIDCHRLIKNQLVKTFNQIQEEGLLWFIDLRDTIRHGGCFFPRHINNDISLPLSRHSWGIAVDINPSTNLVGTKGVLEARIIEIFEKNGFMWGGRWQIPDPMHFECVQIL